jgi:hypothetical protein
MKKMITYFLIAIAAILAFLFIIGLFLPKERTFTKKAILKSEVHKVFEIVTDFKSQATWRDDVKEIIVIDSFTWTEMPKKGPAITFKVKQKKENEIFEIEIIEPKSFKGYWIGTFKATDTDKTAIEFKEVITIPNPLLRPIIFTFVDLNKTMDSYLYNLNQKLNK